jgi:GT2 family glycosyltransferase
MNENQLPDDVQALIRTLLNKRPDVGRQPRSLLIFLRNIAFLRGLGKILLPGGVQRRLRAELHAELARGERWSRARNPLGSATAASSHVDTFFDPDWYRRFYDDVPDSGMDPLQHYRSRGVAEHRSPGPLFDAQAYLQNNPDVAAAGFDPVQHFLIHGVREGRRFYVHRDAAVGARTAEPTVRLPESVEPYRLSRLQDPWLPLKAGMVRQAVARCAQRPRISVLMPVHHPDLAFLVAAIRSVRSQVYDSWELCIADDATARPDLSAYLNEVSAADPRVKVAVRPGRGHISAATNSAAALATGEFFLLLDQDDLLAPDALARCVLAINSRADVDYVFSDSDKIDEDSRHFSPHRKPAFSPELLLSHMCAGQVVCIRAELWRQLGGLREGFEGSQDHDLALRASEMARAVVHVPEVLYHWRAIAGSTARDGRAKPYSFDAGQRAVQEALVRRGVPGVVYRPDWAVANGNAAFDIAFPNEGPDVGIVIPTRNALPLLKACIESLSRTTYRNFEVLVVDNGSDDPETLHWLTALPTTTPFPVRVVRIPNAPGAGFSFSRLVNAGVRELGTEFVVLLNNDTRVIAPEWLSTLVGYGRMPGVGAVGALLLYPDGRVQHGGVVLSGQPPHHVGHLLRGAEAEGEHLTVARNVAAVTAACMLVGRDRFLELGGFDEARFAVAYNDVDFCLRLREAGWRVVFAPAARLYHDESATRGLVDDPAELAALVERHGRARDPYINPHLSADEHPRPRPRHLALELGRPMRVLAVTHNLSREGAPLALLEACRWMVRTQQAAIVVQSPQDGPLREQFLAAGIAVEVVGHPLVRSGTVAGYEDEIAETGLDMRARGIELVLANTLLGFHAVDAAHGAGLPSIWLVHENEGCEAHFAPLPPAVRRRARACFGHPYRVVFVAEASRRRHLDLDFHQNAMVIPGGIAEGWGKEIDPELRASSRHALKLAPTDVAVLCVGTICGRKRQRDLLLAIARLGAKAPSLRAFLVGGQEPGYADALLGDLANLPEECRSRVAVLPPTNEMLPLYAAADILAQCSEEESYPRVVLEAMAAGLPIVTTPVGGVPEQVRAGVNAEFFEVGDVDGLAVALAALGRDTPRRLRYGAASRQIKRTLNTAEDFAGALWEVMREAAATVPPPSRLAQIGSDVR